MKQKEKSHDMQKFTPNYREYNGDVTSTHFHPVKLR